MANVKGITIELGFDNKSKLKLRAIAKHAGALADELEAIDKALECPKCTGILNKKTDRKSLTDIAYEEHTWHECNECGYSEKDNELPTRLEGSR